MGQADSAAKSDDACRALQRVRTTHQRTQSNLIRIAITQCQKPRLQLLALLFRLHAEHVVNGEIVEVAHAMAGLCGGSLQA